MPWRSRAEAVPEREYVALLSYLPLKGWRGFLRFANYGRRILGQLRDAPGLVGFSMRARLRSRQFWTLSVWEDSQTLMAFVHAPPHVEAMERIRPFMGPTRFTRWTVRGSEVPIPWEAADHHRDP